MMQVILHHKFSKLYLSCGFYFGFCSVHRMISLTFLAMVTNDECDLSDVKNHTPIATVVYTLYWHLTIYCMVFGVSLCKPHHMRSTVKSVFLLPSKNRLARNIQILQVFFLQDLQDFALNLASLALTMQLFLQDMKNLARILQEKIAR